MAKAIITCQDCQSEENVAYVVDPLHLAGDGVEEWVPLCAKCYGILERAAREEVGAK